MALKHGGTKKGPKSLLKTKMHGTRRVFIRKLKAKLKG
jgi:hypothetical protein